MRYVLRMYASVCMCACVWNCGSADTLPQTFFSNQSELEWSYHTISYLHVGYFIYYSDSKKWILPLLPPLLPMIMITMQTHNSLFPLAQYLPWISCSQSIRMFIPIDCCFFDIVTHIQTHTHNYTYTHIQNVAPTTSQIHWSLSWDIRRLIIGLCFPRNCFATTAVHDWSSKSMRVLWTTSNI